MSQTPNQEPASQIETPPIAEAQMLEMKYEAWGRVEDVYHNYLYPGQPKTPDNQLEVWEMIFKFADAALEMARALKVDSHG